MSELRQAAAIAHSMWLAKRMGFVALLLVALVWSVLLRFTAPRLGADAQGALSYLPMALSLFLGFILCTFTETDRRGRLEGFPARLFTLPVRTPLLVGAPLLVGVLVISLIYILWAMLVLPDSALPLSWPIIYLAGGMICYQAVVWALAPFRTARLLVLGICGSIYACAWLAFQEGCGPLALIGLAALPVAYLAVESTRRGRTMEWQGWRKFVDLAANALPRQVRAFTSPRQAQFWFEWRRHGMLLPTSVTGVLLLIMAPTALVAPLSPGVAGFCLMWILLTPFLLAFPLGKGFGKADLWSKEAGLPLFLATRPLTNIAWIGTKLKAAALAALLSWVIVAVLTPLWLWLCCDPALLVRLRSLIQTEARLAVIFGVAVILTWRLLAGSLYLGLSGRKWLLSVAACWVFVCFFGSIFLVAGLIDRYLALTLPWWVSSILAGLFLIKITVALGLSWRSWTWSSTVYVCSWLLLTLFMLFAVWFLIPAARLQYFLLALLSIPLARISYAQIALARNRSLGAV